MSQVKDIFDAVKHKLPDRDNLYPAINTALRLISKRLFYHKSSLIKSNLSETISASSSSVSLPSDFWGLMENPWLTGQTSRLRPVPDPSIELNYTTDAIPEYFEVVGFTLNLYPGYSAGGTLRGKYWVRATKLTSPLDIIPFQEMFDDVLEESLLEVYAKKKDTNEVTMLRELINRSVDEIVPYIEMSAPSRIVETIDYDVLSERDWL